MLLLVSQGSFGSEGLPRITNEWIVTLDAVMDSSPALAPDGTIYFGDWGGTLWALNPDGSRKWVFRAGSEIYSSPAVGDDGTIYFGCRDQGLYAVGSDGKKKWRFSTRGWVDSSPALAQSTIYFGSWDKNFYAVNLDGTPKWKFATGGEVVSSPAVDLDGSIYFGSHDKKLYALTPDGKKKWEFATDGPIISSPALNSNQCIYFTSVDGILYAIGYDGTLKWRLRTGGVSESSPTIGLQGNIYLGVNTAVWAISPQGAKLAAHVGEGVVEATPIALADGSVLSNDNWGVLLNCKPDMNIKAMSWLDSHGHASVTVGPTGTIYGAGGDSRSFTALKNNTPLAQTPWPKFRANARNTGALTR